MYCMYQVRTCVLAYVCKYCICCCEYVTDVMYVLCEISVCTELCVLLLPTSIPNRSVTWDDNGTTLEGLKSVGEALK